MALQVCIVHYQQSIKNSVNKCWLFLTFSSVEKIYVFNEVVSLIFSWALRVKLLFILRFMSAYYECKRQEVRSLQLFQKVKCEFLARSHTISLNKGLLNTSSMQIWACLKEHTRVDYEFCALCTVCSSRAVSWNRQDCNRQRMQRVKKHLVNW